MWSATPSTVWLAVGLSCTASAGSGVAVGVGKALAVNVGVGWTGWTGALPPLPGRAHATSANTAISAPASVPMKRAELPRYRMALPLSDRWCQARDVSKRQVARFIVIVRQLPIFHVIAVGRLDYTTSR